MHVYMHVYTFRNPYESIRIHIYRYFDRIVSRRGELMPYVRSFMAVLTVVMLLTSLKTGTVSGEELSTAITLHLQLYKLAYGDEAFRPKHHYSLHLGPMLLKFKCLLATFTQERKHRLVTRYGRDRKNLKNFEAGAIEEITCHQVWELSQPFFMASRSAKARGKILIPLQEIYPAAEEFTILNRIRCNGGMCSSGDVISCLIEGQPQLGELLVTYGVKKTSGYAVESIVALWKPAEHATQGQSWCNYLVSGENVAKVATKSLDTVFTYRMASDQKSCAVYFPPEVRPK
jgi:hypothetical protein